MPVTSVTLVFFIMHCVVVIVITVWREFLSASTMFVGRLNEHYLDLDLVPPVP